ncbi:MAG: FAD-dependent thymidylate synthase [Chloroflexi bacterium]|nr:FAD-dependent thymidylate synthase [Chloroflexota bacterium]
MAYSVRVLADSVSPGGARLTTVEATYPRMVLAEMNTHRMFSRNSASSRAIPVGKLIERIEQDPVVPVWWGKNQSGMQADAELDGDARAAAEAAWTAARDQALASARALQQAGLHKQISNRVLEPWMWVTQIVTATDWAHFYALRCHPAAQPEIRKIAELIRDAQAGSTPRLVGRGGWHLPLVAPEEMAGEPALAWHDVSVGRCARVSYLTHDGKRDPAADVALAVQLRRDGHWSPYEHVAAPLADPHERCGNFVGWRQYRKDFPSEYQPG